MARQKIQAQPHLKSYDEVDFAIRAWWECDAKVAALATKQQQELNKITDKYSKEADPHISEKLRLEQDIKDYCEFHQEDFEKEKTRLLTFGKIGFRKSSKLATLKGWTWAKVLAKLKELARLEFVRTKEEVNKDAIKQADMGAKVLQSFGCQIIDEESFWFEPDQKAIEQENAKMDIVRRAS